MGAPDAEILLKPKSVRKDLLVYSTFGEPIIIQKTVPWELVALQRVAYPYDQL